MHNQRKIALPFALEVFHTLLTIYIISDEKALLDM